MVKRMFLLAVAFVLPATASKVSACTGITLRTTNGETIVARTIEWAEGDLNSRYAVVPRGYKQRSYVPGGKKEGMEFTARYGYVGMAVEQEEFVVEGINEEGLSAGLFYFPGYGEYEDYDVNRKEQTVSDLQLVSWILGNFKGIDEIKEALKDVHVTSIDPRGSTVHWRFIEPSGRQVVLEIVGKKLNFYENTLGVLTNSPGFDWHLTNLNNYINLSAGPVYSKKVGRMDLTAFGGGSGLHGLPGDMTPPSRFVRAAFFQTTAPLLEQTDKTVEQAFHILNNFDIPTGIQFSEGTAVPDIPSATQWTAATDIKNRRIYYRTMYNSDIRCLDLNKIRFDKVRYQSHPLDETKAQSVNVISVR